MDEGRMVDLLLVRLSREDEKKKVIDLLVSELGMTEEEASDKVENSPVILRENVEMEQGRILQDRMYPFVDLLPKYYKPGQEPQSKETPKEEPVIDPELTYGSDSVDDESKPEELEMIDDDEGFRLDSDEEEIGDIITDDYSEEPIPEKEEEEEPMIITSAAEEMITIQRCHICGRTPTDGKKLVPCTTCGELTCADCYNRKAHVCEKCASMGKTVDRPLDPTIKEELDTAQASVSREPSQEQRRTPASRVKKTPKRIFGLPPALLAVVVLVVLAIAFLLLDPMNLFGPAGGGTSTNLAVNPDTTVTQVQDSLPRDTVIIADTTSAIQQDSTVAVSDSVSADSMVAESVIPLSALRIPDSLVCPDDYPLATMISTSRVGDLEVLADSLRYLQDPLSRLASVFSIKLDAFTLIRTDTGYDILLMSILHPEPAERRAAFLGNLGALLDSTIVDQMVLYYRENQYYEPNMFSFTADSFSILSLSTSPYFLQRKQALLPETTDMVTGSLFQWMTDQD